MLDWEERDEKHIHNEECQLTGKGGLIKKLISSIQLIPAERTALEKVLL